MGIGKHNTVDCFPVIKRLNNCRNIGVGKHNTVDYFPVIKRIVNCRNIGVGNITQSIASRL